MELFQGSGVAIVTPFNDSGIDKPAFEMLIDYHVSNGTKALIVAGTTGESATLTSDEKRMLFEIAVKHTQGKVQVIANIGTNNTAESVSLAALAQKAGVDALLAVTPYYNKPNQRGLYAHFKAIASATDLPVILYNVPGRTVVNIDVMTVKALSEISNIAGIKEAAGDLEQVRAMIENTPENFKLYSGNDDLYYDTLALGGNGVISVSANIAPSVSQSLYDVFHRDATKAKSIQDRLDILNDVMFVGPNPVPVKCALKLKGFKGMETRLPLVSLEENETQAVEKALESFGGDTL